MASLDVFASNAFSMQELTAALLDRAHVPMRLGELGLFEARGVRTTKVSVEKRGQQLVLVQTTPRNAPAVQGQKNLRTLVDIPTARIAVDDAVTADEVQSIRSFGSESELRSVQEELLERLGDHSDSITATEEFQRIGALKGTVLDADGSTLLDLFTTFGVSAQSEVAMNIAGQAEGALRTKVNTSIIRPIEDELGGLPYTGIHVMCSSQFFDDLVAHAEVRNAMKGFPEGMRLLLGRTARRTLDFAGVMWEEYRGKVGSTSYVSDDKAHAFPVGVPGLFLSRYAPAEYVETVNTIGLPRYVVPNPDNGDTKSRRTFRVQSNALHICTRPRVLFPLKRGA